MLCAEVVMCLGRECAKDEGMARLVPDIVDADDGAAALLIECRGWDEECLEASAPSRPHILYPFNGRVARFAGPPALETFDNPGKWASCAMSGVGLPRLFGHTVCPGLKRACHSTGYEASW